MNKKLFLHKISGTKMNRILLYMYMGSLWCISLAAQKPPKWIEKAGKAVFVIETYDKNGNMRKGNGFFVQPTGEAVSDYTLFVGAEKAVVTDAEGRKMNVSKIIGADEMYDVCRFMVTVPGEVAFLPVAKGLPAVGTMACILPYGVAKGTAIPQGPILEVTKIKGQYGYFKIDIPLASSQVSVPILTPDGNVFAIAQADASGKNQTYGISVPYIRSIRIGTMDHLTNPVYSAIGIRKAWADTPDNARIALLFYASQDAPTYLETLNDFIAEFPDYPDGYLQRASHYVYHRKDLAASEDEQERFLVLAQEDLDKAMKYSAADEGWYEKAKLIFNAVAADSTIRSSEWRIETALSDIRRAIAIKDEPAYRQLEGNILFYLGDFNEAYESFMMVNHSPLASSISYYLAANAKRQIPGANLNEVIALLDSAVTKSSASPGDALVYLQEVAELKMQFGQYEAAIKDYDQCYRLMSGNVTDAFYYYREQAKFRAGDMDGALDDITYALSKDPKNAVYHAEAASIYLRMQDIEQAQIQVEKALALDTEFASAYRLLGVCYQRRQKMNDACKAFQKAKELGDPIVEKLMRDHCN